MCSRDIDKFSCMLKLSEWLFCLIMIWTTPHNDSQKCYNTSFTLKIWICMSRIIQATQYEVEIWLRIIQKVKDEKLKIIIITISTDCNDLKNQWIICTFTHKFVEIVLNKLINSSMRLDFENVIQTEQI